MKLSGQWKR